MSKFEEAIALIDEYNKKDPNQVTENGVSYPKEYLDSLRQTKWLAKISPEASEALQLATRSQHIGRWENPRDTYPNTRSGYLQWRSDLSKFHASKTAAILEKVGYDTETIERVKSLNLKKAIKLDSEAQLLEDVLCLVFLENHITSFAQEHPDKDKLINIIQKTWKKMGEKGKKEALSISYTPEVFALIKEALEL